MNFVRLDYDKAEESALAQKLGVRSHPAYAFLESDSANGAKVRQRSFGPLTEQALREQLDALIAKPR